MRFEYLEPGSIAEAVSLLDEYGDSARVIAGGTDLLLQLRSKKIKPDYLVDIQEIPGLDGIKVTDRGVTIGAMTPVRTLETSAEIKRTLPVLASAAGSIGSVAIRNVATIGGNLCRAASSTDSAPALIGLQASVRIAGPAGERTLPLESFFTGPGQSALAGNEMLVEVRVPLPERDTRAAYFKHAYRGSIDLAIVGVAVVAGFAPGGKECREVRVVLGAGAPTPLRARQCEDILRGKEWDETLIGRAAELAAGEARPRPDSARASAAYRKEMVRVFVGRALRAVSAPPVR
ncbi:MAG: xanthine dehydrogenase family protein subunit M [Chloroflexota bacterium]